ncbi:transposase family protein [Streptomyces sp. MS06]|uniref:transposase family protein n=1 Tax=Streptomyces sp. MS06 TaxID=3385974 RepID=UPI0039A320DE
MPDPRARRGRWYSLTAMLLVCVCAAVSGAGSVDEIAERAARASDAALTAVGVRRHPLRWRHAPSRTTIGRVLAAVDGDALDRAVGAYLACWNSAGPARPSACSRSSARARFFPYQLRKSAEASGEAAGHCRPSRGCRPSAGHVSRSTEHGVRGTDRTCPV